MKNRLYIIVYLILLLLALPMVFAAQPTRGDPIVYWKAEDLTNNFGSFSWTDFGILFGSSLNTTFSNAATDWGYVKNGSGYSYGSIDDGTTVLFWINLTTDMNYHTIITTDDAGGWSNNLWCYTTNVPSIKCRWDNGGELESNTIASGWIHIALVFNTTAPAVNWYMYENGTKVATSPNNQDFSNQVGNYIAIGKDVAAGDTGLPVNTQFDEFMVFNYTLNQDEIETLLTVGYGTTSPQQTGAINVTITSPIDNEGFNVSKLIGIDHKMWINASFNLSNASCSINSTDFSIYGYNTTIELDGKSKFYSINNTALPSEMQTYLLLCNDSNMLINGTDIVTFYIDVANPTKTIETNNFFTASNLSTTSQYDNSIPINITFTDNDNIFAFSVNITKSNIQHFYYEDLSVNLPTVDYDTDLDISSWSAGAYTIELSYSDGHTAQSISDYKPEKSLNKLKFKTTENNDISISSVGAISTDYKKLNDRYSFKYKYLLADTARTFILESPNKIYYLKDSAYAAHFIVWNEQTKKGNWIDFEGLGKDYVVTKESDNKYNIVFSNLNPKKELEINSIGGLNTVTEYYSWYHGNYSSTYAPIATVGSTQTFTLNVTTNSTFISYVNASFSYNTTMQSVTRTAGSDSVYFISSFAVPLTEHIFNFTWNVNITQIDGSYYNFSLDGNQSVFYATLNITVYDEENNTVINATNNTIRIFLTSNATTTQTTTDSGSALVGGLGIGEYYIQAEAGDYPRRGIYYTVSNASSQINLYLVHDEVGNDYIDYYLRDSSQDPINDVRITLFRRYNLTYVTVAQIETDYAGQARIFQDQQYEYSMTLSHPSYTTKNINLIPLLTSYVINLEQVSPSMYSNVMAGITYGLYPQEKVLNISMTTYADIGWDVYSSDSTLEYFGVFIDAHNYTCIPASCNTTVFGSPAGGGAMVQLLPNATGTFDVHYYFKRSGFGEQHIHGSTYGVALLERLIREGSNAARLLLNVHQQLGTNAMRAVFAGVVVIVFCAIGASMGIVGLPMAIIAVLGIIFMTITGFINMFVGTLIVIVGIASYVVLTRDDE